MSWNNDDEIQESWEDFDLKVNAQLWNRYGQSEVESDHL